MNKYNIFFLTLISVFQLNNALADSQLPSSFALPSGFSLDNKSSKSLDFDHEQISYHGPQGSISSEPAGHTWRLMMRLDVPRKSGDEVDKLMRDYLQAQSWQILTPSGTLVAQKIVDNETWWFKGSAFSGDYRAVIIRVGEPPHSLNLPPPAAQVESVKNSEDFPYLLRFPGAKLVRTSESSAPISAAAPGSGAEVFVGPPVIEKWYEMPAGIAPLELVTVYQQALTKAGWTIIRTAVAGDGLLIAHYSQNGRDIYCYIHDGNLRVADVGAQNEANKLADQLDKDGHVAIYGIYFDTDKSLIKPESETALQHVLELMQQHPNLSLQVQGHTDSSGSPEHNQPLSAERAASVKSWLTSHGIVETRLTTQGFGATKPVADNKTPEGRAKNRRVELAKP